MKTRWIAGLLAGTLLLSMPACQAPSPAPDESEDETRYMVTVDDTALQEKRVQPSEYPAIDADALPARHLEPTPTAAQTEQADEVRAVWVSYLEMNHLLKGQSKAAFTKNIGTVFDNIRRFGLNTVIVQVRPFGDALYDSALFPWSHTVTGTEGKDPGFDPLQIMVQQAQARDLRIEAWVNPYRVRAKGNDNALSNDNPAKQWLRAGKSSVIQYDGGISYNPASADARKLIVSGIVELVKNYEIDGVHIDDYFYPTTDRAFDQSSYSAYQNSGGKLSLGDWRRSNVETLIRQIYAAVKQTNPDCQFGISPQSSVENNYAQQYLDVKKVAGTDGYCDYICPQIYFGYQNDIQPYVETLQAWDAMVASSDVRLYVGLGAYKIGAADSWAGSGKHEWINHTDRMARMVRDARDADSYQGFVLYRYDSLFNPVSSVEPSVKAEASNLKRAL